MKVLAQVEVADGDEINQKLTSDAQRGMAQIANEAMLVITKLNNELSTIEVRENTFFSIWIYSELDDIRFFPQKNYEKRHGEFLKSETSLALAKSTIIDNEQLSFALLDQIQQLYLLLCKRNHQKPRFTRKQIKEQIDFIAEELDTIQQIIQLSNDMVAKETRSDIAQCASTKSDKRRCR